MTSSRLFEKLVTRNVSVSLDNILDNAKAASGGERDVNFLKFLIDNGLLRQSEAILKRSTPDIVEEYYLERYKKVSMESDKHYLCRTVIQDELKKFGIDTLDNVEAGDLSLLRSTGSYDIALSDMSILIDIGLTPARNFFRGLTDLKVKGYMLTTYFDDYMDDIIFSVFSRSNDADFIQAVKDYQEGFKVYQPEPILEGIDLRAQSGDYTV